MGKLRKVFELSFVFERLGCYHARLKFSITLSHKIFNHRFNHRMVIETGQLASGRKCVDTLITTVINVETEHHHYWNHRDDYRHHGHDHDHHRHHIRMTVSSSSHGYHGNQHGHYGPKSHHSGSQTKTPQSAEASIKRKMEGCFFLAPCSSSLPLLFF